MSDQIRSANVWPQMAGGKRLATNGWSQIIGHTNTEPRNVGEMSNYGN